MNLSYGELRIEDLAEVSALRAATRENAITPDSLERDYSITAVSVADGLRSNLKGWTCRDSERIVGFAIGDVSNGEVNVVAVLPDYEALGIGRELLSRVQEWLFAKGHRQIWLLANPDPRTRAHGFYRRLGWEPTGTVKGEDEILRLQNGVD
jgi:GNAT superfamily N-acetyltransferase